MLSDATAELFREMTGHSTGPAGTSSHIGSLEDDMIYHEFVSSPAGIHKIPNTNLSHPNTSGLSSVHKTITVSGPNLRDINQSLTDLGTKMDAFNTTLTANSSAVTNAGETLKTLTAEVEKKASKAELEKVENSIVHFEQTITDNSTAINNTNTSLSENFTSLTNEVITLTSEMSKMKTAICDVTTEVSSLKTEVSTIKSDVSTIKDTVQKVLNHLTAQTSHFTQDDRVNLEKISPTLSGLEVRLVAIESCVGVSGQEDKDPTHTAAEQSITSPTHLVEEGEKNAEDLPQHEEGENIENATSGP